MTSNSCVTAEEIDEQRWMSHIRQMLEEDPEDAEEDIQTSIFEVPMTLRASSPNLYTPQLVALGPYHRNRPHLHEMERIKLVLAKRSQQQLLESIKSRTLVDQLKLLDSKIRACYHRHLGFSKEMLSWMMAIDAAFLLHVLQMHAMKQSMLPLFDCERGKLQENAIMRDVAMLENQIPLLVLRKMMEPEFPTSEAVDDSLQRMLVGLCKHLSPFQVEEQARHVRVSESAHVLDFLYRVVEPRPELNGPEVVDECKDNSLDNNERRPTLAGLVLRLKKGVVWLLRKILLALPLVVFCHLPALAILLKGPVENLFSVHDLQEQKLEIESHVSRDGNSAPPLAEEITIPSAVELSHLGIIFVPTKGDISTINFNTKTKAFCLPIVTLDVNSKVIWRNLVAYEATSSSRPLPLARYAQLMNCIIDSKEDARLLREKGVILNHLKSDEEVARMWNGMSNSFSLSKLTYLDSVIEDVNLYYNRSWRVRFGKLMEVYVFRSWQSLTFVAAVTFLLLMSLQLFSSVSTLLGKLLLGSS